MRLDYVRIQNFKNLHDVEIDFDPSQMTTVIIGVNGTGKSNLIEAIARIFRDIDLGRPTLFGYTVRYQIRNRTVELSKAPDERSVAAKVDCVPMKWREFTKSDPSLLPGMVFGYYSGGSRRLEEIFDDHQKRYYQRIIRDGDPGLRPFFYCRPSYGSLVLLASFAFPIQERDDFLREYLKIIGFESALIVLKKPNWSKGPTDARQFWHAGGLVRKFLQEAESIALAPIVTEERHVDDYRTRGKPEERLYLFIRDQHHLQQLARRSGDEKTFFQQLESTDISDLVREVRIWAKRENAHDEIPFHEVSDGERQLMTVLGLLRYAREEESLFLLDEPDTHLNPAWQLQYLDIIRKWVGDDYRKNSHLIITTHDPLTMASLDAEQVQLLFRNKEGKIRARMADVDARGLGFTGILTQIFGLKTTIDLKTQAELNERNCLSRLENRDKDQDLRLIELTERLNNLGFSIENREPEYELFLKAQRNIEDDYKVMMTPEEILERDDAAKAILAEIKRRRAGMSK